MIYQEVTARNVLEKEYPDLNWGFVGSLRNKERGTFIAVDQLVLLSSAEDKELAFKLMRHLTSAKAMTRFHEFITMAPVAKDEEYHGNPIFRDLYTDPANADCLRPLPSAPKGSAVYDYLYKQLQLMMMGEKSPEDALSDAELYCNMLLKQ
ncbi:hypothetical protein ES708_24131 [subsurface metagenome]